MPCRRVLIRSKQLFMTTNLEAYFFIFCFKKRPSVTTVIPYCEFYGFTLTCSRSDLTVALNNVSNVACNFNPLGDVRQPPM